MDAEIRKISVALKKDLKLKSSKEADRRIAEKKKKAKTQVSQTVSKGKTKTSRIQKAKDAPDRDGVIKALFG